MVGKTRCIDCMGGSVPLQKQLSVCQHGRDEYHCRQCISSFCKHGIVRYQCQECPGTYICQHGHFRRLCAQCGYKCIICHVTRVKSKTSKCRCCVPIAKKFGFDTHESFIATALNRWAVKGYLPKYMSWNQANPDAKARMLGRFRPDFVWNLGFHIVILEVDENQHAGYDPRRELVRISRIVEGFNGIPVHLVRYNPDRCKINGKLYKTKPGERMELLKKTLVQAFDRPNLENRLTVQKLWFDQIGLVDHFDVTQTFQTLEDYETWIDFICLGDGQ